MTRTTWTMALAIAALGAGVVLWAQEAAAPPRERPHPARDEDDGPRFRLTEEQETEVLEHLRKTQPEEYKKILELKESQSRRYRWVIMERYRWYQRYKSMPQDVQKALVQQYEGRVKIARLRAALADRPDPEKTRQLQEEIRQQVTQLFDANQTIRKHYLKELEQRLERFKKEIEQRDARRAELIQEEVAQILADPQPAEGDRQPRLRGRGDRAAPPTDPAAPTADD